VPSYFGNKLISWITGVKLHDYGCTLRGFRSDVVKNLKLYGEMHRYIRPSPRAWAFARPRSWSTTRTQARQVQVRPGPNLPRHSRPDLHQVPSGLFAPSLQIFGGAGLLLFLAGLVSGLFLTYTKFVLSQQSPAGRCCSSPC